MYSTKQSILRIGPKKTQQPQSSISLTWLCTGHSHCFIMKIKGYSQLYCNVQKVSPKELLFSAKVKPCVFWENGNWGDVCQS